MQPEEKRRGSKERRSLTQDDIEPNSMWTTKKPKNQTEDQNNTLFTGLFPDEKTIRIVVIGEKEDEESKFIMNFFERKTPNLYNFSKSFFCKNDFLKQLELPLCEQYIKKENPAFLREIQSLFSIQNPSDFIVALYHKYDLLKGERVEMAREVGAIFEKLFVERPTGQKDFELFIAGTKTQTAVEFIQFMELVLSLSRGENRFIKCNIDSSGIEIKCEHGTDRVPRVRFVFYKSGAPRVQLVTSSTRPINLILHAGSVSGILVIDNDQSIELFGIAPLNKGLCFSSVEHSIQELMKPVIRTMARTNMSKMSGICFSYWQRLTGISESDPGQSIDTRDFCLYVAMEYSARFLLANSEPGLFDKIRLIIHKIFPGETLNFTNFCMVNSSIGSFQHFLFDGLIQIQQPEYLEKVLSIIGPSESKEKLDGIEMINGGFYVKTRDSEKAREIVNNGTFFVCLEDNKQYQTLFSLIEAYFGEREILDLVTFLGGNREAIGAMTRLSGTSHFKLDFSGELGIKKPYSYGQDGDPVDIMFFDKVDYNCQSIIGAIETERLVIIVKWQDRVSRESMHLIKQFAHSSTIRRNTLQTFFMTSQFFPDRRKDVLMVGTEFEDRMKEISSNWAKREESPTMWRKIKMVVSCIYLSVTQRDNPYFPVINSKSFESIMDHAFSFDEKEFAVFSQRKYHIIYNMMQNDVIFFTEITQPNMLCYLFPLEFAKMFLDTLKNKGLGVMCEASDLSFFGFNQTGQIKRDAAVFALLGRMEMSKSCVKTNLHTRPTDMWHIIPSLRKPERMAEFSILWPNVPEEKEYISINMDSAKMITPRKIFEFQFTMIEYYRIILSGRHSTKMTRFWEYPPCDPNDYISIFERSLIIKHLNCGYAKIVFGDNEISIFWRGKEEAALFAKSMLSKHFFKQEGEIECKRFPRPAFPGDKEHDQFRVISSVAREENYGVSFIFQSRSEQSSIKPQRLLDAFSLANKMLRYHFAVSELNFNGREDQYNKFPTVKSEMKKIGVPPDRIPEFTSFHTFPKGETVPRLYVVMVDQISISQMEVIRNLSFVQDRRSKILLVYNGQDIFMSCQDGLFEDYNKLAMQSEGVSSLIFPQKRSSNKWSIDRSEYQDMDDSDLIEFVTTKLLSKIFHCLNKTKCDFSVFKDLFTVDGPKKSISIFGFSDIPVFDPSSFSFMLNPLATGDSGFLKHGMDPITLQEIVVKCFSQKTPLGKRNTTMEEQVILANIYKECYISLEARKISSFVVPVFGVIINPFAIPGVYIVTQLMAGSLERLVSDNIGRDLERKSSDWMQFCIHSMQNIACALADLHRHNIIHKDVAARNILLVKHFNGHNNVSSDTRDTTAMISDFGMSEIVDNSLIEHQTYKRQLKPVFWSCPHMLAHRGIYSAFTDIFAFGVTMGEILTRPIVMAKKFCHLYFETNVEIMEFRLSLKPERRENLWFSFFALRNELLDGKPIYFSLRYIMLMFMCMHDIPEMRPSASQVARELQSIRTEDETVILERKWDPQPISESDIDTIAMAINSDFSLPSGYFPEDLVVSNVSRELEMISITRGFKERPLRDQFTKYICHFYRIKLMEKGKVEYGADMFSEKRLKLIYSKRSTTAPKPIPRVPLPTESRIYTSGTPMPEIKLSAPLPPITEEPAQPTTAPEANMEVERPIYPVSTTLAVNRFINRIDTRFVFLSKNAVMARPKQKKDKPESDLENLGGKQISEICSSLFNSWCDRNQDKAEEEKKDTRNTLLTFLLQFAHNNSIGEDGNAIICKQHWELLIFVFGGHQSRLVDTVNKYRHEGSFDKKIKPTLTPCELGILDDKGINVVLTGRRIFPFTFRMFEVTWNFMAEVHTTGEGYTFFVEDKHTTKYKVYNKIFTTFTDLVEDLSKDL